MAKLLKSGLWIAGITLLLLEVALRVATWAQPESTLGIILQRSNGAVPPFSRYYGKTINSLGYNDKEFKREKPEGEYRIAAIGDSFVFAAVPRERNFLSLAKGSIDPHWEIYNFGIPGAGLRKYRRTLEEAIFFQADLVVLHLYIGNDFRWDYRVAPLKLYSIDAIEYLGAYFFRSESSSVFDSMVYRDEEPTMSEADFDWLLKRTTGVYHSKLPDFKDQWPAAKGILASIVERCRSLKIPLMVLLLPDEFQVDPTVRDRIIRQQRWSSGFVDTNRVNRQVTRYFKKRGVYVGDLTPVFQKEGQHRTLYRLRDTHWNLEGNRLAAREWVRWVKQFRSENRGVAPVAAN